MDDEQNGPRRASRAIVIGFAALLGSAWLVPGTPADENRPPVDLPVFSKAGVASGAVFRSVDAALVDRLPLKGDVVAGVGAAMLAAGVSSSNQVFLGPSREPYLTADFVLACELRSRFPDADDRIRDLRDALAARGVDFLYAVAPDKSSIERDGIGPLADPLMTCADANRADLEAMADLPGSPLLVGWDVVAAEPAPQYIPGDSHWNSRSATAFAALVFERLGADGVARDGLFDPADVRVTTTVSYVGGLYALLGVTEAVPVSVYGSVRPGVTVAYESEQHDGALTVRWTATGPDLIPGRTLILHDSFFDLQDEVFAPYFADVTTLPLTSLSHPGELATLDGYDHVIIEQVQRTVPSYLDELEAADWITAGR